jgi:ribosome-associated protein
MIRITNSLSIDEKELSFSFIRASGPGGQNVNKVATACRLRFDLAGSPSLPGAVKERVRKLAGQRLTQTGEIVIEAQRYRTQERNRDDAVDRLVSLLRKAATPPRKRKPTRPTLASKRRRLESKSRRGAVKRLRSVRPDDR